MYKAPMRKICLALFAAYLLSPDLRAEPVVASQEPGARAAKTKPAKTKVSIYTYGTGNLKPREELEERAGKQGV